jgi:hypothetical protein
MLMIPGLVQSRRWGDDRQKGVGTIDRQPLCSAAQPTFAAIVLPFHEHETGA